MSSKLIADYVYFFFILFYGLQFLLSPIFDTPKIDLAFLTVVMIFGYILHKKYRWNSVVAYALGFSMFFHSVGFYSIIPYNQYYVGDLYGAPQLSYHYDWIVHALGFMFGAIGLCGLLFHNMKKALKSSLLVLFLIFLIAMGIGSLIEIAEYSGFETFGYGTGFLRYGAGDSAPEQDPWANASIDMIFNLAGIVIGLGLYFTFARKKARVLDKDL